MIKHPLPGGDLNRHFNECRRAGTEDRDPSWRSAGDSKCHLERGRPLNFAANALALKWIHVPWDDAIERIPLVLEGMDSTRADKDQSLCPLFA